MSEQTVIDAEASASERFEERAAILEFCSGMTRTQAEQRAAIESAEWLRVQKARAGECRK